MAQAQRASQQIKKPHSITLITIAQSVYLVGRNYSRNSLISHARACAFAFLFSFVPIFMMVALILIRILHASPETIEAIFQFIPELNSFFDINTIIMSVQTIHSIRWFELAAGFFIFWIARGLFATIFKGLQDIFHAGGEPRPVVRQIVMIIIEVAVVILVAAIVFFIITVQTINTLPIFNALEEKMLPLTDFLSRYYINRLPNILLFLIITILYKIGSGTKPSLKMCIIFALLCNISFWAFRLTMHTFINYARYNLIYGILAKLIITMLDVFIFFLLFFFYAQLMFVYQFFDDLLLGELYLLPGQDASRPSHIIRRMLFIRPDFLLAKDVNVIHLKKGDTIFTPNDTGTDAYYIARGMIQETRLNGFLHYERGDFFGETSCVLKKKRETTATCMTDTDLVRIDEETFQLLVAQNGDAAKKVLSQISTYFTKLYGLTGNFPL